MKTQPTTEQSALAAPPSSALSDIVSDFVDNYSYADMAYIELDDNTREIVRDAILTLVEREDFAEAMEAPLMRKRDSDFRVMRGLLQILKETGASPPCTEILAAAKRYDEQNTELSSGHDK